MPGLEVLSRIVPCRRFRRAVIAAVALAGALSLSGGLPGAARAQVEAEFADEFDAQAAAQGSAQPSPQAAPLAEGSASASGQVSASADGAATAEASADAEVPPAGDRGEGAAAGPLSPEERERQLLRVQNTWLGPAGGIHLVDAGSGVPGTFRLQLGIDFFSSSDYLIEGDENDYVGGTLSLSWTALDFLEAFASVKNHANSNTMERPELLQVLGDTLLGLKGFAQAMPWLTVGGDARVVILNSVGDIGPVAGGTSFGLRANLATDFRQLESPFPLIGRLSVDYFFDNSAKLIEDVEEANYEMLGSDRRSRANEDRHLLRRAERFGLGINRLDMFSLGLGFEAPLQVDDGFFIHPLLEWTLGIPVNRQDYSCLLVATDGQVGSPDSCLDIEGIRAMPSALTLAARVYPGVRGLTFGVGVDIGLTGASTFVRELAPNKPYDVLFTLGYSVDGREPKAVAKPVEVVREVVKEPPPKPRVQGTIVDSQTGQPVAFATVRYPDLDLTAQQADAQGQFVSYPLDPGEVRFEALHVDYEARVCVAQVPAIGAPSAAAAAPPGPVPLTPSPAAPVGPAPAPGAAPEPAVDGAPQPAADGAPQPAADGAPQPAAPAAPTPLGAGAGNLIPVRCELVAKPRNGSVRGQVIGKEGQGVAAAKVQLTGKSTHDLTTDATGQFAVPELEAGQYTARIDAEGYLLKMAQFEVKAGITAMPSILLVVKPDKAQVELTQKEVRIRKKIFFMTDSAELSDKSHELLSEVADVLLRNPQVKKVEIQGHTDNKGDRNYNVNLSQSRAESVMKWLIDAGVSADRLTARGYGDTRPLVPNLTDRNRARNRRVQFIIREQE